MGDQLKQAKPDIGGPEKIISLSWETGKQENSLISQPKGEGIWIGETKAKKPFAKNHWLDL